MADERFSHISKDPRFRAVPKKERKVKIDHRFQSMFKDERFNYKYSLDKRGRPFRSSTSENLRRYYDLSDDSSDESDEDEDKTPQDTTKVKQKTSKQNDKVAANKLKSEKGNLDNSEVLEKMKNSNLNDKQKSPVFVESEKKRKSCHLKESSKEDVKEEVSDDDDEDDAGSGDEEDSDDAEEDDDDDDDQDESGLGSGQDLARGIGNESSSSDDSDFDSLDEIYPAPETENIVHDWGEMDKDAVLASESSSRLAICNMDWENMTAADLFVVLNSFKPPQGAVLSVKIYPSEFGLKRMEEENQKGPLELAEIVKDMSDDENTDSENEEGNTFHNEKLRQYEINRMKYYYAVVECDCDDTANYLYNELDGSEYEQSRTCFDMRFIPADMEFTETARDVCTEMPSKDRYKPNQFVNNAMSASTVSLSWDETNRHRVELTTQTFSKKQDMIMDDFKAYLASSSDDSENEGLNAIGSDDNDDDHSAKSDSENEEGREAKINKYKMLLETAEKNMKKKQGNVEMEITWEPGLKEKAESLLKQRSKKQNSTPWLDYLDKVKAKRKEKKSARKAAAKKETSEEKNLFSDDDMPSDVDLNDPYFSSELKYDSNKKSKTQKKKEKRKKKLAEDSTKNLTEQEIELKNREKEELALLMADDNDGEEKKKSKHHFDFEDYIEGRKGDKKKKSKKKLKQQKSKEDDDFKIDVNDKRFEAVFTSGHYNIDKSAPDYKKSAGMEELIEEKLRRRYNERTQTTTKRKNSSDISGSSENYSQMNATNSHSTGEQSLDSLVRSIKSKMSNLHNSKKKKIK